MHLQEGSKRSGVSMLVSPQQQKSKISNTICTIKEGFASSTFHLQAKSKHGKQTPACSRMLSYSPSLLPGQSSRLWNGRPPMLDHLLGPAVLSLRMSLGAKPEVVC